MMTDNHAGIDRVCVAYLTWGPLGLGSVRQFVDSYRRHDAGIPHELVVILNDVGTADATAIASMLRGIPHRAFPLDHAVFDLEAYRLVTEAFEADAYCFLNTYSRVLARDWLVRYVDALGIQSIGVAGASGAYQSMREFNPWRSGPTGLPLMKHARLQVATTRRALVIRRHFPASPCPYVRSNAFAMRASTIDLVGWPRLESKMDTWRWESGRRSLTARTLAAGMRCVLIDRFGGIFDIPDWPASGTFWSRGQGGLLVADNRSDRYDRATEPERRRLERESWAARKLSRDVYPGGMVPSVAGDD